MIFEPYTDELEIIQLIHKYNSREYALIRLTDTMFNKNNIDANVLLRELLKRYNVLDYEKLLNGGSNGHSAFATLIYNNNQLNVRMNFYKVKGKRSDPRFSIYGIKKLVEEGVLARGDLLYFTVAVIDDKPKVILVNTSRNTPSKELLTSFFGIDDIKSSVDKLLPLIKDIARQGYHPNSKGIGKVAPKDVGDTLEFLLGIKANNSKKADFDEKIEIKSKLGKTLDTLFTLRPNFEGTYIASIEPIDKSRVSAFTRHYGYFSDKHPDHKSLYVTIGTKISPQNSIGFYLEVADEEKRVEIRKKITDKVSEVVAFWTFEGLEKELHAKHPATLWVKADQRQNGDICEFKYHSVELTRSPQFATFLAMIKTGVITYDWRGYTTPKGKYSGKNHGNAWRIKSKSRALLFGSIEKIELI
ncbi:restriction endonuclease [Macrococcus equipercicus]|uniref:Restriction endonuclease n=1 Tax=Macrococcus equipercicus TaxID=69967 RepID=A0ABQ6R7I7_9STAP|nr:MvaI/BcnI family restriction endonuclease [Macrococcus equipercicus]KAA1039067.1 restriction endonuclease [Macrococcus equipercicus]